MSNYTFKITIVGEGGVGKTSFLRRCMLGDFDFRTKYTPTLGVATHPIRYMTNYGLITLNVWDTAGQEKYKGVGNGYYIGTNAFILMYDVTSSTQNISFWFKKVRPFCEGDSIFLVGNKTDAKNSSKQRFVADLAGSNNIPFRISVRSGVDNDKPFLNIMRHLTNYDDLEILKRVI